MKHSSDGIPRVSPMAHKAILLMLHGPDTSKDAEAEKEWRRKKRPEDGWFLPRDFTREDREYPAGARYYRTIHAVCRPEHTSNLRKELQSLDLVEVEPLERTDKKGRTTHTTAIRLRPIFVNRFADKTRVIHETTDMRLAVKKAVQSSWANERIAVLERAIISSIAHDLQLEKMIYLFNKQTEVRRRRE